MRNLAAALLLLLSAATAGAQTAAPSPADRTAIRDVISRQIQAFQHDDAVAAFSLASRSIQQQMGTPARFLDLVRQHYEPVYRPQSTVFGRLLLQDGQIVQQVDLVGPDGRPAGALYSMEQEPDGGWRISGCVLTASESVAA